MTHQEAQLNDTIERYVRHQLSAEERRAFQQHYFQCQECFEQTQTMAQFIAGIQQASRKGLLAESAERPWWAKLFKPAMVLATSAALLLAIWFGRSLFNANLPAKENLATAQSPTPEPTKTSATPIVEENRKPQQQDLLAQNRPTPIPELAPGKAPFVTLDSERDASNATNQLTIPVNAANAILRVEIEANSPYSGFQFQIFDSAKRLVTTISGKANAKGTVSANVPAQLLQSGKYVVKCFGQRHGQFEPIGEYRLQVQKL